MIPTSPHPMWNSLRVRPDERSEINGQLLRFRDAAQKLDRNQSGFPPGFKEFCLKHLARITAENPWYKAQVQSMVRALQENMAKVQLERDQLDAAFNIRIESVAGEIQEFLDVLPAEEN